MSTRSACYTVLGALALALASTAHGQSPSSHPSTGRFVLGGGLDALDDNWHASPNPALALQGGYERRLGASRFGVRVEGTYWRRSASLDGYTSGEDYANGVVSRRLNRTVSIGGVNVLGTYQFAPAARVRPYALAGIGYQRLSERRSYSALHDGVAASLLTPLSAGANSVAYTGGLGFDVPLGRAALFVEGRLTRLPGGEPRPFDGIQSRTTPLTFGIKF